MITTAQVTDLTRMRATELVNGAARKSGSLMAAYDLVARSVGVSPGWLRRFIKNYEAAREPRAAFYENIRANYEAFCNRVEQENQIDEQRLHSLRRGPNASTEGSRGKADS
ncbi:MAG: hypothetical protein JWO37_4137 [Acidimicrobiales bacterium]|nr:hypothetical protein [Acidimicrobiales bacterium]